MNCFLLMALFGLAIASPEFKVENNLVRLEGSSIQILSPSKRQDGSMELRADITASPFDFQQPYTICESSLNSLCLQWDDKIKFNLKREDNCSALIIEAIDPIVSVESSVNFSSAHWYGGAERLYQDWPVQKLVINEREPFTTREENHQAVVEGYWVNSEGVTYFVDRNTTLFITSNSGGDGALRLIAANEDPYKPRDVIHFGLEFCEYENPKQAHLASIEKYLGKAKSHPGIRMMTYPTYSTWAEYKSDINQQRLIDFTNQILDNNFLLGQIVIDDRWETCYGSLKIDTERFPNMTQLTDYIHSKGGRVVAWVHPFVNTECPFYQQYIDEGRLVRAGNGNYVSSWWNGAGGLVDITNQTTRDWWVDQLKSLKASSGLDGYKVDAGESGWLPQLPEILGDPQLYPDFYVNDFVSIATEFSPNIEVRVGRSTQDQPLFMRMIDKDSRWGLDNGLQSVITTALQFGLAGYPFILPDMIGGNAYGETPSKELFIRWVEASALMPAMQFSILPWDYDQETADISRKYLDLHTSYTEKFLKASNQTLEDGRPIIAPVWWDSPDDEEAYPINDQFFMGEDTLVAPVLVEGAVQRDVYLPSGTWLDSRQQTFEGPTWLRNYDAPLDFLPIFTKVTA